MNDLQQELAQEIRRARRELRRAAAMADLLLKECEPLAPVKRWRAAVHTFHLRQLHLAELVSEYAMEFGE